MSRRASPFAVAAALIVIGTIYALIGAGMTGIFSPEYEAVVQPRASPGPSTDSVVQVDTIPVDRFNGRGLVTWYGKYFQGRRTASGERYDRWKLTAACNLLPFGTLVRVSPAVRRRGRAASVVVRINDTGGFRGPFLDLSQASFARIAPLGAGVIICDFEVIGRRVRRGGRWCDSLYHKEVIP
jgi:rare lipoprotein A